MWTGHGRGEVGCRQHRVQARHRVPDCVLKSGSVLACFCPVREKEPDVPSTQVRHQEETKQNKSFPYRGSNPGRQNVQQGMKIWNAKPLHYMEQELLFTRSSLWLIPAVPWVLLPAPSPRARWEPRNGGNAISSYSCGGVGI